MPLAAAKAGKTPARPAPTLLAATLGQARALLQEAKDLRNEGVNLRKAGNNEAARDKQSAAKVKIDAIKDLVDAPLLWQEEAELEGWAQPPEYVTLANFYGEVSKIEKDVRMGGGTR
jgi:hypothetical protein